MKKKAKSRKANRRRGHHHSEQSEVEPQAGPALSPGGWPLAFQKRREIRLDVENVSFVTDLLGIHAEGDAIRIFMCGGEDSTTSYGQANRVGDFCGSVSWKDLVADGGDQSPSAKYVAWLDERALDGEDEGERARYLPLTAHGLYRELEKPRFPSSQSTVLADVDHARDGNQPPPPPGRVEDAGPSTDAPQSRLFDADRRLLFVTDLNRAVIYALACTAPKSQIPALPEAIYEYLESKASVQVTSMTTGSSGFKLAFHLPYSVWRTSKPEQKDHRTDKYGKPLRRSQDVSFIHLQDNGPSEFLYEAHISCVITGLDDWRWVAYCFTDTYFDPIDEARDNIYQNYQSGIENGGFHMDHLTGLPGADRPIRNPREYFLKLLSIHLLRVRGEWEEVVRNLEHSLREYEQVCRGQSFEGRLMGLAAQESDRLSQTVLAVENFLTKDEVYFHDLSELAQSHPLLVAIRNEFEALQRLKTSLERVEKRSNQFARNVSPIQIRFAPTWLTFPELELDLGAETIRIGHQTGHYAIVMMLFFTPIALTSTIFSMNPKVIPFLRQDFRSFVELLLFLFVIGLLVLLILTGPPDFVIRHSADRRLKVRLFKLLLRSRKVSSDEENRPGGDDYS